MKWFMSMALSLVLAANSAQAAVVTLTGGRWIDDPPDDEVWREHAGFIWPTSSAYFEGGLVNLHDDGGLMESAFYRPDGARFSLLNAVMRLPSRTYRTGSGPAPADDFAFDDWSRESKHVYTNFGWYGYRLGSLAASWEGFMDTNTYDSYAFDPTFTDLDRLIIRFYSPDGVACCWDDYFDDYVDHYPDEDQDHYIRVAESNMPWIAQWSGELFVQSVTFDVGPAAPPVPVPLPAALPLSALALGLLGAAGLRRRA